MRLQQIGLKTVVAMVVCQMALSTGLVHAATSLNLDLEDSPDISVGLILVEYGTGVLAASGEPMKFNPGDLDILADAGDFSLNANINSSGILSSGTFSIDGAISGLVSPKASLLEGNLTAFGYNGVTGILEFKFDVTGGALQPQYTASGRSGGIIMGGTGFTGSFADPFSNELGSTGFGFGTADVGVVVPLPSALPAGLALLGGIASGALVRRKLAISQ